MTSRWLAALPLLVLLFPAASGAASFGIASSVGAATTVPVTLASGSGCTASCTTALDAPATSAQVGTVNIIPNPSSAKQVLKVLHGSQAWSVQLRVTGASPLVAADGIVLTLAGATSSALQLTSSTAFPATTSPVTLQGGLGAADLAVTARGTCVGTCVIAAELALASSTAAYTYAVVLTVT